MKTCTWRQTPHWLHDMYHTECGEKYFIDWGDTPKRVYCSFCGGKIIMRDTGEQIDEILKRVNRNTKKGKSMKKMHLPPKPLTADEQLRLIHYLEKTLKIPSRHRYVPPVPN